MLVIHKHPAMGGSREKAASSTPEACWSIYRSVTDGLGYSGETVSLGSHSAAPTDGMMPDDLVCERNRVQTLNPSLFITSCEPHRSRIRIGYC